MPESARFGAAANDRDDNVLERICEFKHEAQKSRAERVHSIGTLGANNHKAKRKVISRAAWVEDKTN